MRVSVSGHRSGGCTLHNALLCALDKLLLLWSLCAPMLQGSFSGLTASQLHLWVGGTAVAHYFFCFVLLSVCGPPPLHLPVATRPATPRVKLIVYPGLSLKTTLGHLVPSQGRPWKMQYRQKPHHRSPWSIKAKPLLQLWFNYMSHIRAQTGSTPTTLMKMLD